MKTFKDVLKESNIDRIVNQIITELSTNKIKLTKKIHGTSLELVGKDITIFVSSAEVIVYKKGNELKRYGSIQIRNGSMLDDLIDMFY